MKRNRSILQPDSIDLTRPHLQREGLLRQVEATARERQHVIVGGPPATGKSSLLELLRQKMEKAGDKVVSIDIVNTSTAPDDIFNVLKSHGVTSNRDETVQAFQARDHGVWLLIDEAQNGYSARFEPVWSFLFKSIVKYGLKDKLFVVVASTYDETLGVSPVHFNAHPHISPHITGEEARTLYKLHTQEWQGGMTNWSSFCDTLLSLSWIVHHNVAGGADASSSSRFHIGVVIAGIYLLQSNFKRPAYTENDAMHSLRSTVMISNLDRCFAKPRQLPDDVKAAIVDNLMGGIRSNPILSSDQAFPFVRRGLLNEYGGFSCLAANWYYNAYFFPGRATSAPATLDSLVIGAVEAMSQLRLQRSRDQGNFPKEAAFQQLFNEEMNKLLPPKNSVLPELNTKATQNGKVVSGELDFYVNSELKWALELLKEGIGIGQHLARFHPATGKYREVDTNQYLVVDLRGPRSKNPVTADPNRCTFYFEDDFSSCICKMRNEPEKVLQLQP